MLDGHGDRVEEHQDDDEPIEPLRFDGVPDPEAEPLLGQPEALAAALIRRFFIEIA